MTAAVRLAEFFNRNGVLRVPDLDRRKEASRQYHKGYEVRLIARNETEVRQIGRALETLGLEAGSPYTKAKRTVIPLYGRDQVREFIARTKVEIPDLPDSLRS